MRGDPLRILTAQYPVAELPLEPDIVIGCTSVGQV
jgi:hypothetical protein